MVFRQLLYTLIHAMKGNTTQMKIRQIRWEYNGKGNWAQAQLCARIVRTAANKSALNTRFAKAKNNNFDHWRNLGLFSEGGMST